MFDSRSDAARCTLPGFPTSTHMRRTHRKGPWGDDPRQPLLVRPTQPKSVAYYEAWLDWQDVQDERAIAEDGLDIEDGYYGDGFMHMDDWASFDAHGRFYRTESEPTQAGRGYAKPQMARVLQPQMVWDRWRDRYVDVPLSPWQQAKADRARKRMGTRPAAQVNLGAVAKAKNLRRQHIETQMAEGVLFPDLDPYTLEPIRTSGSGSVVVSNLRPRARRYA